MRSEGAGRSGGAAGGSSATEDNHRFPPEKRRDFSAFLRRRVIGTAVGGVSLRSCLTLTLRPLEAAVQLLRASVRVRVCLSVCVSVCVSFISVNTEWGG